MILSTSSDLRVNGWPALIVLISHSCLSLCSAFTAPCSRALPTRQATGLASRQPSQLHVFGLPSLLTSDVDIVPLDPTDIPLENAFQDSISLTDGPVGILAGVFVLFIVLAVALKAVMGQMDSAIEKVLADFETTVKAYYPERWEKIEEEELKGLAGDERDVQLLKVMEQLQVQEPEFMTQVADRSTAEKP
ncbi:expressed unknown protein [Seminavis robusta]|uniref:Uncharacterized protein n=1 Tax=Seminavis robusta TaxID=568900 RepID=A0A9N8HDZ5_9STRA|nr:expressed unknown protein [Seminavis robusta]|eukprot:Sro279_g106730.1 n/a (191) ;mRNA; r:20645-21217